MGLPPERVDASQASFALKTSLGACPGVSLNAEQWRRYGGALCLRLEVKPTNKKSFVEQRSTDNKQNTIVRFSLN